VSWFPRLEVDARVLLLEELFELRDRRPLDRLAGDRALEDHPVLLGRIDGQLEGVVATDVNVGVDLLFTRFANSLARDLVAEAIGVEQVGDRLGRVAEDVEVDVGALANVPREDAPNQPGAERGEPAHHP
jgi:hypothetical protein